MLKNINIAVFILEMILTYILRLIAVYLNDEKLYCFYFCF